MRKRLWALAATVGLVVGGGLFLQAAEADTCTAREPSDPRGDGNEVVGVYVDDVPVDVYAAGATVCTDGAWVEVQDNGNEAPNLQAGWQGKIEIPKTGPVPHFRTLQLTWTSPNPEDELP